MTKKRLAFVTNIYRDNNFVSGGVKLNYILCKGLQEHGYKIDLFAGNISMIYPQIFNQVFSFDEFEKFKQNYDFVISDKACVPSDVTYIHDHSYPYRAKMMFTPFRFFLYKIFCISHHKKRYIEFIKVKENICKCKKVVVSSKILEQDIVENYSVDKERVIIIPPPVEKYQVKRYKNRVFTFGISAPGFARKGGYIALGAINALKKKNVKFKVKFIYSSVNLAVKLLVKLYRIEDYCEFIPAQADMGKFYNSIDALIMPSIIEPFGMVAGEALGTGCPVITAEHCGAADCIKQGYNGYIYKGNSPQKLADAMFNILDTVYLDYLKMCENSVISVNNLFQENFVDRFVKLLESV